MPLARSLVTLLVALLTGWVPTPATSAQSINHALTGTATQSTAAYGGVAALAIDGVRDGLFVNGSVTHTANTPGGWWEVVLASAQLVDEVRIYNRSACCAGRLSNFRVTVFTGGTPSFQQDYYTTGGNVPAGQAEVNLMPNPVIADRVRIELLGPGASGETILSLAEVEVLEFGALPAVNLAVSGVATQSSTGSGGVPERVIDGNVDGFWGNGSVSHTSNTGVLNSWWEVVLPARTPVDLVRLWNRSDCCANRLSNFRVSVFDGPTETFGTDHFVGVGNVAAGRSYGVTPTAGTVGDRVRVALLGLNNMGTSVLSLAEVEILRHEAGIVVDVTRISAMTGGMQTLTLDAGAARAGSLHWLVGSASGTTPGFLINGFFAPLNPDAWFNFTLLSPNLPPYVNTLGSFDFHGRSTATISVPALVPGIVGISLHHAFAAFDNTGTMVAVSNAVPLVIDP